MKFNFVEILDNSIRFTSHGSIRMEINSLGSSHFFISVTDTGLGMSEDQLKELGKISNNILDQNRKKTSGFGLFISNHLANCVGPINSYYSRGITVFSQEGLGTKFSFVVKNYVNINEENNDFPPKNTNTHNMNTHFSHSEDFYRFELPLLKNKTTNSEEKIPVLQRKNEEDVGEKKGEMEVEEGSDSNLAILKCELDQKSKESNYKFLSSNKCFCNNILIVDDTLFNLEVCKNLLKKIEVDCDVAHNGIEAIDFTKNTFNDGSKFCDECKFYKIIFMDIDMPIKNGIETTRELIKIFKENDHKKTKIIGLSAFHQENIILESLNAGMVDYITKPVSLKKLSEIIEKYLVN